MANNITSNVTTMPNVTTTSNVTTTPNGGANNPSGKPQQVPTESYLQPNSLIGQKQPLASKEISKVATTADYLDNKSERQREICEAIVDQDLNKVKQLFEKNNTMDPNEEIAYSTANPRNINRAEKAYKSFISLALDKDNAIASLLISLGAIATPDEIVSYRRGHILNTEAIQLAKELIAPYDIDSHEIVKEIILYNAVIDPNIPILESHFDKKLEYSSDLLVKAIYSGNLETIGFLIKAGVDPSNETGPFTFPLVETAFKSKHFETKDRVEALKDLGVDLNAQCGHDGYGLIHRLASWDYLTQEDLKKADVYISAGLNIHAGTCGEYDTETAFHIAASEGNIAFLKYFETKNRNEKNGDGNTPSGEACFWNQLEVVEYFFDLLLKDSENQLAEIEKLIPQATRIGVDVLKFLIEKQPSAVFTKDGEGNTLLHQAVKNKNYEAILYLLDKGLNPSDKNNEGKIAFDPISYRYRSNYEREEIISHLPKIRNP